MVHPLLRRLALCLSALAATACATVSNGPMQAVKVDSNPAGARVRLYNCGAMATRTATTPATVWVSRRSTQCRVRVSVPGEEESVTRLVRHVSPKMQGYVAAADVLCGPDVVACNDLEDVFVAGVIGAAVVVPSFAVDAATGSMFQLTPSKIYVDFARRPEPQ